MGSSSSTANPTGASPSYLSRARDSAASTGAYLQANATKENAAAAAQKTADVANTVAYWSQGLANLSAGARQPTALQAAMTQEAITGGCDCAGYFGGATDEDPARSLREYYESRSAKAKEGVIRRLGRALNEAGLNIADPDNAPLDDIVAQLVAQIPNPRAGRTFSSRAADHEHVCKVVANALNAQFTPGATRPSAMFIDSSLGPEAVCRAVGEWVHSFAAGVNTEFLDTVASVRNALGNLRLMEEVMKSTFEQIRARVDAGECGREDVRSFAALTEIYERAQEERHRQEELLNNILHTHLGPLELELETAMRDESESNVLIQKIGLKPGTGEFANTLAMAISGLGTAASIAHRVNKALKTVGATIDDYLRAADDSYLSELDDSLLDRMKDTEGWAEVLAAMATLRDAFSSRKDPRFAEALRSAGKTGGAATVDDRVRRLQAEKKALVADFSRRLAVAYEEFVRSLKALTPELGSGIPLGPEADTLRDAVSRLTRREERLELALIGYYTDAEAKEKKEGFLQALKYVSAACSSLDAAEGRGGAAKLQRVKAAVEAIEKVVDRFTDRTSRFSGGAGADDEVVGGADSDLIPHLAQSGSSLAEAASEFTYFYYIAKVRENFSRTAKEIPSYGEKYENLLGGAVAAKIDRLLEEKKDAIAFLEDQTNRAAAGRPLYRAYQDGNAAWLKAAKEWVEKEFEVKIGFYRALEAVDLYLKAFTEGIVSDPGAVRDIRQHLEGVKVIARWYNENSGDAIWKAFECMRSITPSPNGNNVADAGNPVGARARDAPGDAHYYDKLSAAKAAATAAGVHDKYQVGLPFLGVLPGAGPDAAGLAKKYVSEAYDNFQGLKNLFNAFMRIGVVFGGTDIRRQVFMSPTQLYKSFLDYLKHSALSLNLRTDLAPAVPNLGVSDTDDISRQHGPHHPEFGVGAGQVFFGSVGTALRGSFAEEDEYFAMAIKAVAGKVLVALGVYDMFDRRTPYIERNPTRAVLGGAVEPPAAIVGATALYFRLPRLVEFYRCLRWEPVGGNLSKVAMLPELEGIFSGLIRIIFVRSAEPTTGDYTESELHDIIREVNQVWNHFHSKHGERAVDEAVTAFVTEINRRLGIVKGEEMEKYWGLLKRSGRGNDPWSKANNTDYMILPGEGEDEPTRRAPSDWYPSKASRELPKGIDSVGLDTTPKEQNGRRAMLRVFMNTVEKSMGQVDPKQVGRSSYALMLKQMKTRMQAAATDKAKLEIAMELVQGSEHTSTEQAKALMFNETVVLGLNVLSSVERYITLFEQQLEDLDLGKKINFLVDRLQEISFANNPALPANKAGYARFATVVPAGNQPATPGASTAERYILPRDATPGGVPIPFGTAVANPYYGGRAGMPPNARLSHVRAFILAEATDISGEYAGPGVHVLRDATGPLTASAALGKYKDLTDDQRRYLDGLVLSARLLVDTDLIMADFIEALYALHHSSGGLIEVKLTATGDVMLGFTRLRELAEALLADVKHYLDVFRPYVSQETIKLFESSEKPGSVYWLERELFDRRFRGTSSPDARDLTMDGISRKTTNVLRQLKSKQLAAANPAAGLANPGWAGNDIANRNVVFALANGDPEAYKENYGRALSQLVFYDASLPNSGMPADLLGPPNPAVGVSDFALGNLVQSAAGTEVRSSVRAINRRVNLYTTPGDGMGPNRSLMGAFNQLVAWYLTSLSEPSASHRIYSGLVTGYANGPAARSVMNPSGNSFPDITRSDFGQRGDPKADAVLCQSLAYVFQRIVTDVEGGVTQVPKHMIQTLTDVPAYLKEGYRATLPSFVRLFDLLAQKGEFIKEFFQRTGISCKRPDQFETASIWTGGVQIAQVGTDDPIIAAPAAAAAGFGAAALSARPAMQVVTNVDEFYTPGALMALEPLSHVKSSEAMKLTLTGIIDAIGAGLYTLSSSATEVLKELGDQPIYFQIHEGSIEAYRMRQGQMPLMPLSLTAWSIRDLASSTFGGERIVNDATFFPKYHKGEVQFRFQYGVRGLLVGHRPVTFEQMPGVKTIIDNYNGFSAPREQLDAGRYLAFNQRIVDALRYITEGRNFKSAISTSCTTLLEPFNVKSLLQNSGLVRTPGGGLKANVTWALATNTTITEVTGVVETTNQEMAVSRIVQEIVLAPHAAAVAGSRAQERAMNIVDLNIEPIIPSAFMRDIPLANLFNYELAFERMAAALYGENSLEYTDPDNDAYRSVARIEKARQMFLALLCDPYLPLDAGAEEAFAREQEVLAKNAYDKEIADGLAGHGHGNLGVAATGAGMQAIIDAALQPPTAEYTAAVRKATKLYGSNVFDMGSDGHMHRIFRGDNDLGLGRPKFLSDQLFNKALLGNLFPTPEDHDSAGPGVGAGVSRGRAGANEPWRSVRNITQALTAPYNAILEICDRMFVAGVNAIGGGNAVAVGNLPVAMARYRLRIGGNMGAFAAAIGTTAHADRILLFDKLGVIENGLEDLNAALDELFRNLQPQNPKVTALATELNALINPGAINFANAPTAAWTPANIVAGSKAALTAALVQQLAGPIAGDVALARVVMYLLGIAADGNMEPRELNGSFPWFRRVYVDCMSLTADDRGAQQWRPQGWGEAQTPMSLTYINPAANAVDPVVKVGLTAEEAVCLEQAGRARFDTRFVRNLVFVTSALRLVRLKLNRELTHSRKVVVENHLSVAPGVTEFGIDPFSPNETLSSNLPGGYSRFDDAEDFGML